MQGLSSNLVLQIDRQEIHIFCYFYHLFEFFFPLSKFLFFPANQSSNVVCENFCGFSVIPLSQIKRITPAGPITCRFSNILLQDTKIYQARLDIGFRLLLEPMYWVTFQLTICGIKYVLI